MNCFFFGWHFEPCVPSLGINHQKKGNSMRARLVALLVGVSLTGSNGRAAEKDDVEKLGKELRERERKIAELESQLKAVKQSVETLKNRDDQLVTQLERLTKELGALKGSKSGTADERSGAL